MRGVRTGRAYGRFSDYPSPLRPFVCVLLVLWLSPFASLPRRSPRGVVGPSASSSRRWNYDSAGAGLVHVFDSRRAVCELFALHNTQIMACFLGQLD